MTPTVKTLTFLRELGYEACDVTGYKHPKSSKFPMKQDLFGCVDIVAFRDMDVLFIQTTNKANVANHIEKYRDNKWLKLMLKAGLVFLIYGWDGEKDYDDDEPRQVEASLYGDHIQWNG